MNRRTKLFLSFLILLLVLALGCGMYVSDYYPAGQDAQAALVSGDRVTVTQDSRYTVFSPALPEAGFLFYPGGKVEYTAYAPLMRALAEENILCVLVRMPGNLAVLDADAAEDILPVFPEIDRWYIGGHSLGGSMAASLAAESGEAAGLALLASYSTADLTGSDLDVLSIYGDRDQVLDPESYQENRENLPAGFTEILIPGGNHSQFGDYGHQEGDGQAATTADRQLQITRDAILGLIRP